MKLGFDIQMPLMMPNEGSGDNLDPHDGDELPGVAGAPGRAGGAAPAGGGQQFELSEDGNIVKVGGKSYVTEAALHQERTRAGNYAKTLQTLEPLMPEFEEFLANKRGNRETTVRRATAGTDNSDYSEDELNGYAITRGYYDGENKPDLKRAKDDLDIMTAIADRRATRAVRPVAEQTGRDRARDNVQSALEARFVDGEPLADEKYVRAAFDAIPDNMKADDGISQVMQVVAVGLQALDDRRNGRVRGRGGRGEPVFRESGDGRTRDVGGDQLDALDRAAAKARGKSPEQWAKLSKVVGGTSFGGTVLDEI